MARRTQVDFITAEELVQLMLRRHTFDPSNNCDIFIPKNDTSASEYQISAKLKRLIFTSDG